MATQDNFIRTALRVPPDLHKAIHEAASGANRTFNAEIIARLQRSFEAERDTSQDTVITRRYKAPKSWPEKSGKDWSKEELEAVIFGLGKIIEDFKRGS